MAFWHATKARWNSTPLDRNCFDKKLLKSYGEGFMAQKKNDASFTVTDRRLFTSDGELRSDAPEEVEAPKPPSPAAPPETPSAKAEETAQPAGGDGTAPDRDMPPPPTSAEQDAQAAAYHQSARDLDKQVELSGHSAKDFEITFE